MELFGALFSPFVRKVAVVAAEKGLAFAMPPFSFSDPCEDFLTARPAWQSVAAMETGQAKAAGLA